MLLKDRFLKKMLLKEQKPVAFFSQDCRLKNFFYSNWKQFQAFKITNFDLKITVHYGLWAKCTSCDPLIEYK